MHHNILPASISYNKSALLRGLAKHTPDEAEIEVRDLMVVGELGGQAEMVFLVIVYLHRPTGRLFTKPETFDKSVLTQLEADGQGAIAVTTAA